MIESDQEKAGRYIELKNLNAVDRIRYSFSPREFGNMAFPYGEMAEIIANRRRFLAAIGITLEDIVFMRPVHKVNIEVVGLKDKGKGALEAASAIPSTDALITTDKGVGLALNAADCAPVILTNRQAEFLALYHAGREGTDLQIGRLVVNQLKKMGFTNTDDFVVGVGPAIGKCCYGQQYLQTHTPEPWLPYLSFGDINSAHVVERINSLEPPLFKVRAEDVRSKLYLDINGFNRAQLIKAGVPDSNITVSSCCTACDAEKSSIFSHVVSSRYAGTRTSYFPEGRFMAVAMLKED